MTALDAIGPHEILFGLPNSQIFRVAENVGPILTDSGLILMAEHAIANIQHANVLIIPGAGNATCLQAHTKTFKRYLTL